MSQLGFRFADAEQERATQKLPRKPKRTVRSKVAVVQLDLWELKEITGRPMKAPEVTAPESAPPPLSVTLRGKMRVEDALRQRLGPRVLVELTSNHSTMISFRRKGRALYVRVHAMFGNAPDEVLVALASFIANDRLKKKEAEHLDDWIEKHRAYITKARAEAVRVKPVGEVYNLKEIFDALNREYFNNSISADITWTIAAQKQRRSSIHMGTYSPELKLIRIHPALDQEFVPKYVVEAVVFHEMLHQVYDPPDQRGCRRSMHPPEFRRHERTFKDYDKARRWESQHLGRLLRY